MGLASLGSATLVNGVLNLLIVRSTSTLFGPQFFGTYVATQSLVGTLCVTFASLNLRTTTIISRRELTSHELSDGESSRNWHRSPYFTLVCLVILWIGCLPWISRLLGATQVPLIPVVLIIPMSLLTSIIDGALYGLKKFSTVQLLSILSTVMNLTIIIFLQKLNFQSLSVVGILSIAAIPSAAIGALLLQRQGVLFLAFRSAVMGAHTIGFFVLWFILRIPQILAPQALGSNNASNVAALVGIQNLLIMSMIPLASLLIPFVNDGRSGRMKRYRRCLLLATLISTVLSLAISTNSEELLLLIYGNRFGTHSDLLSWTIFASIGWCCLVIMVLLEISNNNVTVILFLIPFGILLAVLLAIANSLTTFLLIHSLAGLVGLLWFGTLLFIQKTDDTTTKWI